MKRLVLLFGSAALCMAQDQPGNFEIRCEPTAKLQPGADIPLQIRVADDLHKPLIDAKVTVTIAIADRDGHEIFKAPTVNPGVYLAKPVFPVAGTWDVLVEVRRNNRTSSRNFQYNISN